MEGSPTMDWKAVMKNSVPDEDDILEVLENKDHKCAVLLDGDKGLPLLSISAEAEDGRTLIAKGGGLEFMNIFERDGQRFTFRLTNFTQDDIFFLLHHGADFDKGKAVNKVNILVPQRTYVLESDYSNGEKEMFLNVRKDEKTGESITVAKDEDQGRKGTYFSLKVCPTRKDQKWNNAVWTCPDFVCLPKKKIVPGNGFITERPESASFGGFCFVGGSDYVPAVAIQSFGAPSPGGFGSAPVPVAAAAAYSFGASGGNWGSGAAPPSDADLYAGIGGAPGGFSFGTSLPTKDNAFATNLRHGNVRQANSQSVEMAVYFEHAAPIATFCMAVMSPEKLSFFSTLTNNQRLTLMLEAIYEFRVSRNKKLLESIRTVHKEEECCICMDAAPSYIFIKCGHGAVCNGCAPQMREQRCPLCRAFIEGKINL